ncbi:MAG: hypothetical protein HN584_07490, partial [Akkermansiaceae bacterium]|nr:hypothetical protein [Akkermansiaceae bacterium]
AHAVECRVGQDKEIIAVDLEVIEPGVLGETVQLPARSEVTIRGWLVNIQRLAATNEQTPGQVHRLADKELFFITVEKLNAQRFVGQLNAGHFAPGRDGEKEKAKRVRKTAHHLEIITADLVED